MGHAILKKCAICGRPEVEAFRPFCSSRCANIDLGRWLNENYAIPAEEAPDDMDSDHNSEDD